MSIFSVPSIEPRSGLTFTYRVGDVVHSKHHGLSLITKYGYYDETYWIDNGIFGGADYFDDIEKKATTEASKKFLKEYRDKYKAEILDTWFPKGHEHHQKYKDYLDWLDTLIQI